VVPQDEEKEQEAERQEQKLQEEIALGMPYAGGRLREIIRISIIMLPLLAGLPSSVRAETLAGPALPPGGKITTREISDLRKYLNGAYVGLEYREVRGVLDWEKAAEGEKIDGTYYVLEELSHDGVKEARKIDDVVPVSYSILADGTYGTEEDAAYPTMRGFPVLPVRETAAGESWRASGIRIVQPPDDGPRTRVKIFCEYVYKGEQTIDGAQYRVIEAKYAVRYKKGEDPSGDGKLQSLQGSHTVSIRLSTTDGALSLMRDYTEETYLMTDGKSVTYKGFILTYFNAAAPMDRGALQDSIAKTLKETGVPDITVTQKPEGVTVSLSNIHFIAEQAAVLPEEKPRLEALAAALKQIPKQSFRVIGHTARIGTEKSQYDLSVARAKAIVDFLVSKGIAAERFIYEGRGGTEPVAPNDTEESMAKNRRVEIVILEDGKP
jgi:OmpA-OmpF porin, OOP family